MDHECKTPYSERRQKKHQKRRQILSTYANTATQCAAWQEDKLRRVKGNGKSSSTDPWKKKNIRVLGKRREGTNILSRKGKARHIKSK